MPFRNILGQENAVEFIRQALKRNRIPQAWLFTGQKNIGKFKTAVSLALQEVRPGPDATERAGRNGETKKRMSIRF